MTLLRKLINPIVILVVLLFIAGNVAFAEDIENDDFEGETLIDVKEFELSKGDLDRTLTLTKEEPGTSTNSTYNQKIMKMGIGGGSGSGGFRPPAGKHISSNKEANKVAKRFDYDDAHDMKKDLLTGQKDKTPSHYNIYQVTESGKINGDIYLTHTRTNTFYKTTYNYYRPYDYIPLPD